MDQDRNDINIPVAFSGPAQLILFTRYGDPRAPGWDLKWLTTWHVRQVHPWFPKDELVVHKHLWPLLHDAFSALFEKGLHAEIKSCENAHGLGYLPSSPVLSVHSWGAAIDMNAPENPRGSIGKWSKEFLAEMSRNGIYCGQNWTGNKEPMHFSMVDGE